MHLSYQYMWCWTNVFPLFPSTASCSVIHINNLPVIWFWSQCRRKQTWKLLDTIVSGRTNILEKVMQNFEDSVLESICDLCLYNPYKSGMISGVVCVWRLLIFFSSMWSAVLRSSTITEMLLTFWGISLIYSGISLEMKFIFS